MNEKALEQHHLDELYKELLETKVFAEKFLQKNHEEGLKAVSEMGEGLSRDVSNYTNQLDTFSAIEMRNREIDQFNMKHDSWTTRLENIHRSLEEPFFGRIDVIYDGEEEVETYYLGVNSFINVNEERKVYDWRAPIGELYYSQELGETSYEVNSRKIPVDLKKRRQFKINGKNLISFFDSSIAIRDELLLEALESNATQYMQDITSTIQKEQNEVIRDTTSRVLLVNGIAGSGKTSAVLQRIAYLLYQYRNDLLPTDVVLLSPNPIFVQYISKVLPNLGEKNPINLTIHELLKMYLPRWIRLEEESQYLERNVKNIENKQDEILRSSAFFDFLEKKAKIGEIYPTYVSPIRHQNKVLIDKEQILKFYNITPAQNTAVQRVAATTKHLEYSLDEWLRKKANSPKMYDRITQMTEEEQMKYFGRYIQSESKEQIAKLALQYLNRHYKKTWQQIRRRNWLNVEEILRDLYQEYTGEPLEFSNGEVSVDLATALIAVTDMYKESLAKNNVKFVLVDETQDYSAAQMKLLLRLFGQAKYTLLGDENQAIFKTKITFEEIRALFEEKGMAVTQKDLLTSYRSNAPITNLFKKVANHSDKIHVVSVQEGGKEPLFIQTENEEMYLDELVKLLREFPEKEATAIITKDIDSADKLYSKLRGKVAIKNFAHEKHLVPGVGLNLLPISLAKGLEFDHVVIDNASNKNYQTDHDRQLLYTGISRAMKSVSLPYIGEISELLGE
ncbi:MAG: AAA family ATPase [Lactobacillales bacterium]|nr:AAA family ATPase [Lactobacillales bacterium]